MNRIMGRVAVLSAPALKNGPKLCLFQSEHAECLHVCLDVSEPIGVVVCRA